MREDNWEAVTLFPPDCHDEILQTDVPIAPKPSYEPLILTEGSLISSPSGKKNSRCPKIHLSVTKWTLIFSIWRKALNRSAINSGSKTWKIPNVIRNVILRFKSCFLRAWISIWFYSLLLELAEWYDKSIGTHTVTFLLQNFELDFRCAFNHTRSFCEST